MGRAARRKKSRRVLVILGSFGGFIVPPRNTPDVLRSGWRVVLTVPACFLVTWSVMKRLEPVIWAKGTFLTPQHLQIQDRFLENTLRFQLDALSFRPWGFRQLLVNQELLAA